MNGVFSMALGSMFQNDGTKFQNLTKVSHQKGVHVVYFLAHFCPVAFFRQMIALKITLSTIFVGTKVPM
jgi:hypothetical protein